MIKYLVVGTIVLCLLNVVAYAGPVTGKTGKPKAEMSLGIGAIIGGLIGGPPGAIIGAAGGAWYGDKQKKKDDKFAELEKRLHEKQTELTSLQGEFANLEARHGVELQKVKMQQQVSAMEKLSHGVTLTVFFRTNSSSIEQDNSDRIKQLAQYLKAFPEIQLNLEAYADRRGTDAYNQQLSRRRAEAVKQVLVSAGLPAKRIHSHAYGESRVSTAKGDYEGYIFDRRVRILLSLDNETYAVN